MLAPNLNAPRAQDSGTQSVEYGVGLLNLAELESEHNPKHPPIELYAQAAQVLGERPPAARALTHLGLAALALKNYSQAADHFQHAQRVDPAQAGTALMWTAVVRAREKNPVEAEGLFQGALTVLDPQSVAAAVTMEVYAAFLREQGRAEQAGELETRATAIQRANAPPANSQPIAGVHKVSAGVTAPSLLHKVEPEYTEEARMARVQGMVIVQVVVGTDGLAHDARIVKGLGLGLDGQTLEAISQWQFKPGVKDGQPVKVAATIEVNWRLL